MMASLFLRKCLSKTLINKSIISGCKWNFSGKPEKLASTQAKARQQLVKKHNHKMNRRTYFEESGWMPDKNAVFKFQKELVKKVRALRAAKKAEGADVTYTEPVQKLADLISTNSIINNLVNSMLSENTTLMAASSVDPEAVPEFAVETLDDMLDGIDYIIQNPPTFTDTTELIGVPLAGLFTGLDATLAGQALFVIPEWNTEINNILQYWHDYLSDPSLDSNRGFLVDGENWLSQDAIDGWSPDWYVKDSETIPYYESWNSWFTRDFTNKSTLRPIAGDANDNSIITAPQDGAFYCIDKNILHKDAFWFKDMPYSLNDIFTYGATAEQLELFESFDLAKKFENGDAFQCFLGPYNFHRWWAPASGTLLFDPQVVPGFYYSKNKIPDIEGSTTGSVRYLAHCNARGIVVINTSDIGYVCCIPIGMCEVSTIKYNEKMISGASVSKGDELGMFQFGGSTFAILFEDLSKYGKQITWKADGIIPDIEPPSEYFPIHEDGEEIETPSVSGTGNILCGSQIAVIEDI